MLCDQRMIHGPLDLRGIESRRLEQTTKFDATYKGGFWKKATKTNPSKLLLLLF